MSEDFDIVYIMNKIFIILIITVSATSLSFFLYTNGYFDSLLYPKTEQEKEFEAYFYAMEQGPQIMEEIQKQIHKTLAEDTYGGKTPEDTLKMYMNALKKRDYVLASKYYFPWQQELALVDIKDWENYPDALQEYLDAYDKQILDKEKNITGYSITMYNNRKDRFGYGYFEFELNKVNNIWKLTNKKFVKKEDRDKY